MYLPIPTSFYTLCSKKSKFIGKIMRERDLMNKLASITPLSYKQHSAKTLSRLIVVEGSLNCSYIETVPIKKETNQHKITNTLYLCIFIILISM